jgi:hypothetical protein
LIAGLLGLAGVVAVILKLSGVAPVAGWSWWVVTAPWWVGLVWQGVTVAGALIASRIADPALRSIRPWVFAVWWALAWRWTLWFGSMQLGVAGLQWIEIDPPGPDLLGLYATLGWLVLTWLALRAALAKESGGVARSWWAVVWRHALGSVLIMLARLLLDVTPGAGADYLLLGTVALAVSVWSAWGVVWCAGRHRKRHESASG